MKRGLPRSLMTDNGAAMTAGEVEEGLHRLGIVHAKTMAYSPYQNGKMEVLWASVEGRLMAMLEGVEALTLKQLNDATVAWVEHEYHRRAHRELGTTPMRRLLDSPDASRPCPESAELQSAFRITVKRTLRRSDATVSVEGVRYQVPAPWRHLRKLSLRVARWDLACVELVDPRTAQRLTTVYPLDKRAHAGAVRRPTATHGDNSGERTDTEGDTAPLLKRILDDQAACGMLPAWVPHGEHPNREDDNPHGDC